MIKAIFFDLDGTLLDSNKRISKSSVEYLNKCKEKNIKLFIATARLPDCTDRLNFSDEEKELFDGGVFCNGAVVIVGDKSFCHCIDHNVVSSIINAVKKYPDLFLAVQKKGNVHAFNKPLPDDERTLWGISKENCFSTENCSIVDVITIMIFDGGYYTELKKLSDEVINNVSKTCGKDAGFYLTDEGKVIQISGCGISKYQGVEEIRKTLMYDKSECVVFGDDYNDVEMLSNYENSYAMGNSPKEIKNVSAYITDDNDSDGIANALKRFVK